MQLYNINHNDKEDKTVNNALTVIITIAIIIIIIIIDVYYGVVFVECIQNNDMISNLNKVNLWL